MKREALIGSKLRMALIACIASMGLALGACNGDDENNGNNGNNGVTDAGDVEEDVQEDVSDDTQNDTDEDANGGETAMVQVIHASPDPAASTVDVWVEGQEDPLLDDFEFKSATEYTELPAGVDLNIGIAGSDSSSYDDSLKTWEGVQFAADSENVVIAHGIVSPEGDQPALDLLVTQGKTAPSDADDEIKVAHTSPDAPTVDIVPNNSADNTIPDLSYGDAVGYLPVPNGILTADVVVSSSSARAASFQTPELTGGKTWVVLATGFLEPTGDQPAFGLTAVDNDGNVADLEVAARAQIIHASPAAAADPVDLYLNGEVFLEDVAFRASTGFLTVPSGVNLEWDVVPAGDELANSVANASLNFNPGDTAIAAAVGDGDVGFSIVPKTDAQEMAMVDTGDPADFVDITVLHASPDAPNVDVGVAGALDAIAADLEFANFTSGYFEADAAETTVIINDETQSTLIGEFVAPLDTLGGAAITVVATGYAEPEGDEPALEIRVYDGSGGTGTALSAP
jgi:hypothetical protein